MPDIAQKGAREVVDRALSHADALYNFARWLARDPTEAEDLVQETYARALAAARSFEPGTNLKAWLFRILRNLHLDRLRRLQRDPTPLGGEDEVDGDAAGPSDELDLEPLRALVAEDVATAVNELAEPFRTAVLLDLEGLTEAEAGEVMGCAPGTVKSRLSRARAQLRRRLRSYRR